MRITGANPIPTGTSGNVSNSDAPESQQAREHVWAFKAASARAVDGMEHTPKKQTKTNSVDDRRREARLPCSVTVVRAHMDELDAPVTAELVEVSSTGMKLHVAEPIPVGTRLTIDTGGMIVMGDVRYCALHSDQSYSVGLMMFDVRAQSLHGHR